VAFPEGGTRLSWAEAEEEEEEEEAFLVRNLSTPFAGITNSN
jgi:hypothetical protein